jgi:hypothetical protein
LDHTGDDPASDTDEPKLTGEAREQAEEILKDYDTDDRPTVVLPGSGGTVSGTAVSEWVDEDGNPKFGKESAEGAEPDRASTEE